MKLVIDIPEKDIPKNLGTMEINLSFCNGTVCQCDYPFETDIEHDCLSCMLDKIKTEIDRQEKWLLQAGYTAYNVDIAFDAIKSVVVESEQVGNPDRVEG